MGQLTGFPKILGDLSVVLRVLRVEKAGRG
jgi:hypothetical protein